MVPNPLKFPCLLLLPSLPLRDSDAGKGSDFYSRFYNYPRITERQKSHCGTANRPECEQGRHQVHQVRNELGSISSRQHEVSGL